MRDLLQKRIQELENINENTPSVKLKESDLFTDSPMGMLKMLKDKLNSMNKEQKKKFILLLSNQTGKSKKELEEVLENI